MATVMKKRLPLPQSIEIYRTMKKAVTLLLVTLIVLSTGCIAKDKKNIVGGTWQRLNVNGSSNLTLSFTDDGAVVFTHTGVGVTSTGTWKAKATALYHLLTIEDTEDVAGISVNAQWNIIRLTPELMIISTDDFGGQVTYDFVRQ